MQSISTPLLSLSLSLAHELNTTTNGHTVVMLMNLNIQMKLLWQNYQSAHLYCVIEVPLVYAADRGDVCHYTVVAPLSPASTHVHPAHTHTQLLTSTQPEHQLNPDPFTHRVTWTQPDPFTHTHTHTHSYSHQLNPNINSTLTHSHTVTWTQPDPFTHTHTVTHINSTLTHSHTQLHELNPDPFTHTHTVTHINSTRTSTQPWPIHTQLHQLNPDPFTHSYMNSTLTHSHAHKQLLTSTQP